MAHTSLSNAAMEHTPSLTAFPPVHGIHGFSLHMTAPHSFSLHLLFLHSFSPHIFSPRVLYLHTFYPHTFCLHVFRPYRFSLHRRYHSRFSYGCSQSVQHYSDTYDSARNSAFCFCNIDCDNYNSPTQSLLSDCLYSHSMSKIIICV